MGLAFGLILMALAVAALHRASLSAGDLLAHSRAGEIESDAYFYTEAADVREFLDDEGRYGRALKHEAGPLDPASLQPSAPGRSGS